MENKNKIPKILRCDFCECEITQDNEVRVYSNEHDSGPACDECVEHYNAKYAGEPCGDCEDCE